MAEAAKTERWRNITSLGNPGVLDPRAVARWRRWAAPIIRLLFRPRLRGADNLPDGPFLLVSNHSGMGLGEIMSLIVVWLGRFGTERPIAPMVHPFSFESWPAGGWMKRLGAIPSTYDAANAALAKGVPVLVFPGGDHEAMRPVWQASQVQFAGRKGFLKVARAAGVPVVPMGIRGSHYTAPVLWRSDQWLSRILVVPRLLGIRRFSVPLLAVLGVAALAAFGPVWNWWLTAALMWLALVVPVNQLPWVPWSIRIRVGAPIANAELFPDDTDEALDAAYERVQGAVQALVTRRALGREV